MLKIIIGFDECVWFFEISLGEKVTKGWFFLTWLNNWLNLQPIGANGKKTGKQGLSIWFGSRCLRTRVWGN